MYTQPQNLYTYTPCYSARDAGAGVTSVGKLVMLLVVSLQVVTLLLMVLLQLVMLLVVSLRLVTLLLVVSLKL